MQFVIDIASSSSASDEMSRGGNPTLVAFAATAHRARINGTDVGVVVELPGQALHARRQIRSLVVNAILPLSGSTPL